MHLKKLHLVNFCQHRDLTIEFAPGITGVIGGNGRGKSNLLKAIRFALIKASGNHGVMADDLNWEAAQAGESGFVELIFEKNGIEGKLKRFVNKGRATLEFGDIKAKSARDVDARMAEILGVPKKIIEEVVFVDQGAIERILFERRADRAKQFQALFGTANAENIRLLLQQEAANLPITSVDEQIDQLTKQLTETIEPTTAAVQEKLQQLERSAEQFDERYNQQIIADFEAAAQLTEELAELRRQLEEKTELISVTECALKTLDHNVEQLKLEVLDAEQAANAARERMTQLESLKRLAVAAEQLKRDRATQEAVLAQLPPTAPAVSREALEQSKQEIAAMQAELASKRAFVAAFKNGENDAICPTCHQNVHNAAETAAKLEVVVQDSESKLEAVEALVARAEADWQHFESKMSEYSVRQELAKKRLAELDQMVIEDVDYNPDELDELKAVIHTYTVKAKQLEQLKQQQTAKATEYAAQAGAIETLKSRQQQLTEHIGETPTEERYMQARAAMAGYRQMLEQIANLQGQLQQLEQQRQTVLTELERLKAENSRTETVNKYKSLCERARAVLHRDCLPLIVTRSYLAGLNSHMNKYLEFFETPFTATIKDDLSVICTFPGVGEQAAGRLSGGQKVVLGIAFRFAVYRLFANELGFMALDEPTAMLDDDKIQHVVDVMQVIRRYAQSTGMQLIVPTHRPQLETVFDHAIYF